MFFKDEQIAPIKLVAGIVNDGEISTQFLNLERVYDVYFSDSDYYNCNVFPIEWIEIFSNEKPKREEREKTQEILYSPFCSPHEL